MNNPLRDAALTVAAVAVTVLVLVVIAKNVDVGCINLGFWKSCTAVVH